MSDPSCGHHADALARPSLFPRRFKWSQTRQCRCRTHTGQVKSASAGSRAPQVRCVARGFPTVGHRASLRRCCSGSCPRHSRGRSLRPGRWCAASGWLPGGRVLVALAGVGGGGDRDQGAVVSEVVGVRLAILGRPGGGAGVSGLGERDQVVVVEGAGRGEEGVVVARVPGRGGEMAAGALLGGDDGFRGGGLGTRGWRRR